MPTRSSRPAARGKRRSTRSPAAAPRSTDPRTAVAAARGFRRLVEIMQILRSRRGCPWDRQQNLGSLREFVLEETYEVLEAIDRGDRQALLDEIGDLLFEGVFLAQICADEGHFTVDASLEAVTDKLVRRHPHVFGPRAGPERPPRQDGKTGAKRGQKRAPRIETPGQVLEQWERIKAREQEAAGAHRGILTGVPRTLPALLRAHEIGTRVAAVGFDWARPEQVVGKIEEEVAEFRRAIGHESPARAREEVGDLLFSVANLCRKLGIEPESALRTANEKFTRRFAALEARFADTGRSIHDATSEEMEREWESLKLGDGHE